MRNIILLVLVMMATLSWGQNYTVGGFSVTIKGSSNLHEWESYVKEVRANGQIVTDESGLKEVKSLYVEMPVKTIKSPKGSIMDGKTYDALKADACPNITFKLEKASITKHPDFFDVNTTGNLTIAGVTKKIDLYAKGKVNGDVITFSGSKKLKMTMFNISPPTALMGTLTTGDDIEVFFSLTLKKS